MVCEVCGARFRGSPSVCPLDGGKLVDVPDPMIGRTIAGRYVVHERIGVGGMGTVYRARHDVVGRDVAVKFLSPELAYEPSSKTRFLREARAANKINHEHIIDITDYGETDDGMVYLVMEFLDGVPLNEEIARGPMPVPRAYAVALQIAHALARAHELDVIHRDIKPDNIFLLRGYEGDFVKILDFGLAHMKGELRVTATGTIFGTPEYMSPEQARGAPLDPRTDLYSVGCVLFEMLTAMLPFQGSTPDLILKHLREPPRAPSFHVPTLPPEVDALVLRMLEKDPEDRLGSAFELADEVKSWLEAHRTSQMPRAVSPRAVPLETTVVDEHPSGPELVDRWRERVHVFRELVARAHPDGDAPSWLAGAIEGLALRVQDLATVRGQLLRRATQALSQQEEVRDARLRIGRALDALAADETRLRQRTAELEGRLAEAQARLQQVERPLRAAWAKLPPHREDAVVDAAVLTSLRDAGALATIRLDAARTIEELTRDLERARLEREDVSFQIQQLKGRLGGMSAVSQVDMDGLREETTSLDRRLQTQLDEVVRAAEPIVRHFMAFPHLRDVVRGTHA